MNKIKAALLAVATGLVAAGLALAVSPAEATVTPPASSDPCRIGAAWFVNSDEADRKPERTTDGFVFESTDLIHHNAPAGLTLETLTNGGFTASPNPDQDSFFSVEVSGTDGKYGTLRWNRVQHWWEATSQGEQHHDTNPAALADAFPIHLSHTVVRFGVGYTANPPGTVKTTVKSVSFMGKAYPLNCFLPTHRPPTRPGGHHPTKSPTATPTVTPTTTRPTVAPTTKAPTTPATTRPAPATPTPGESSTPPIIGVSDTSGGSSLPLTGPPLALITVGGLLIIAAGVVLFLASRRRRKVNFTA